MWGKFLRIHFFPSKMKSFDCGYFFSTMRISLDILTCRNEKTYAL